jgi:ribosomal protein S18 acetylase RimI-like enzyme
MKNKINIRGIRESELAFLDDMLYEAIFVPEGKEKPSKDVINLPEVARYIKNFGRTGDICLVAELKGELVGAIWIRLFSKDEPGYGFVDESTPELAMAVRTENRSQGIGKLLMEKMLQRLKAEGYKQVSLSVDKINYAYDFYLKCGFEVVDSTEDSYTMVKRLR